MATSGSHTQKAPMIDPLPFSVDSDRTPYRRGNYCWMVVLPDGREAQIAAGRVTVDAGVLQVWQTHAGGQEFPDESRPLDPPQLLLALPPGSWVNAYAASVLDTSPVCVLHVAAPQAAGRR